MIPPLYRVPGEATSAPIDVNILSECLRYWRGGKRFPLIRKDFPLGDRMAPFMHGKRLARSTGAPVEDFGPVLGPSDFLRCRTCELPASMLKMIPLRIRLPTL